MARTNSRRIFYIAISLFVLAGVAGLSYYIWYSTYYKYNIADHGHTFKFSESDYKVKVIWQRKDWQCRAEIYKGKHLQHEIDLGRWFTSNERGNSVLLVSGYGSGMWISVQEDSPNVASIAFCIFDMDEWCTYFKLNNLQWYCESKGQNEIYRNLPFVTTEMRHTADKLSDFRCSNPHTTS